MSKRETTPLPVMVIPQEDGRKRTARTSKTKKAAMLPKKIYMVEHKIALPVSSGIRLIGIAIQIQIVMTE